jgi:hypothetical protein
MLEEEQRIVGEVLGKIERRVGEREKVGEIEENLREGDLTGTLMLRSFKWMMPVS